MKQESEGISVKGCVEVLAHASNRICFWIRFISTPKPFQSGSVQTQALDPDIPRLSCHSKTSIGEEEKGSNTRKYSFFIWVQMRLNFWKNRNEPTDHAGSKVVLTSIALCIWSRTCCPLRTLRSCSCSIYHALIQSDGLCFIMISFIKTIISWVIDLILYDSWHSPRLNYIVLYYTNIFYYIVYIYILLYILWFLMFGAFFILFCIGHLKNMGLPSYHFRLAIAVAHSSF